MGAFSPSPLLDEALQATVMREIVDPVLAGLAAEGQPYTGFLYAGLMLTCDGPKVIEFNVRFGDPEAQVVIPAIEGSFARLLASAADGQLPATPVRFANEKLVGVVLASEGYPASGPAGRPIDGLEDAAALLDVMVFHSGTAIRDGRVVTAGGRVLTVVGRGTTFDDAIARAYAGVAAIRFEGMHYRRDIGAKARGVQAR
jgi:phosphoribosylamine--glycine ligase